ncbi:MAG TPA: hypothetical protein VN673_08540 [Clostridia bacterium]|nr:hypothetical protein [Clostridia bacterium]
MDFTPLFNSTFRFTPLILGIGLLAVIVPYPLRRTLAVVIVVGLLIVLVPASLPYLLAVGHALFNLFAFLFTGFSVEAV